MPNSYYMKYQFVNNFFKKLINKNPLFQFNLVISSYVTKDTNFPFEIAKQAKRTIKIARGLFF